MRRLKNIIFQSRDLCLRALDTNSICAKNVRRNGEKYEKWRYEDLPILPSEWNYQIAKATRKQFGILKKLMEVLM